MLLLCCSLLHVCFATYTLWLCCARLITPLVEAQRDAVIQLRYTFTVRPVQRDVDIQLRLHAFALLLATDYRSGRHRRVV